MASSKVTPRSCEEHLENYKRLVSAELDIVEFLTNLVPEDGVKLVMRYHLQEMGVNGFRYYKGGK